MGWLGYTADEALATDVNAIMAGQNGKIKMLRMCFGGGEDPPPARTRHKEPPTGGGGKPVKMTAQAFDAVFGGGRGQKAPSA